MKRTLAIPKANIIIAYLDSIVATLISKTLMLSEWNELYIFPRYFTDHDILGILNTDRYLKNASRLI